MSRDQQTSPINLWHIANVICENDFNIETTVYPLYTSHGMNVPFSRQNRQGRLPCLRLYIHLVWSGLRGFTGWLRHVQTRFRWGRHDGATLDHPKSDIAKHSICLDVWKPRFQGAYCPTTIMALHFTLVKLVLCTILGCPWRYQRWLISAKIAMIAKNPQTVTLETRIHVQDLDQTFWDRRKPQCIDPWESSQNMEYLGSNPMIQFNQTKQDFVFHTSRPTP